MRLLYSLAFTVLTLLNAQAQNLPEPSTYDATPAPELILQWLHSPDPRLQAWAAHNILKYRFEELIPDLQSQLELTTPTNLSDAARAGSFRTTLVILDTLIQLGSTVPATTLARIEKLGYNAHTEELVLLSRLPWEEAAPMVRSFYTPDSSTNFVETRVAAQLLAGHPTKGFAAELLSTIVVTGRIFVHDANGGGVGGFGSGSSSCCGAGLGSLSTDWPETVRYSFRDPPRDKQPLLENETLFLSAPDPVYLLRSVNQNGYLGSCGGLAPLNDAIRSRLVGTLLRGTSASPFPEQPVWLDVNFQSREAYRAQVQAFVDQQQENFYQVTSTLTSLGLLTEEERQAAALRINLSLQDLRTQPAEDIPALSFRPPVQWVPAF